MAQEHSRPQEPKGSRLFDLEYQLLQYASHHDNPVNKVIHLTCIPLILWSALVFAAKTGPLLPTPTTSKLRAKLFETFPTNAGTLAMAAYCAYYMKLDKVAGLLTTPLFMGAAKHATHFNAANPNATKVAGLVHIFAWIAQFIGHGVYEKRAPKLTENLVQALVLAPYFVVYEVLFSLGYRPQLRATLNTLVEADIREWKAKKALQSNKRQ
ncbi:hypothetical protein BGZ79_000872 [Entomortierella chlamydospora]|nr:hypothetical protein BGZ79_000872 [Entomortierella chlamydospora]